MIPEFNVDTHTHTLQHYNHFKMCSSHRGRISSQTTMSKAGEWGSSNWRYPFTGSWFSPSSKGPRLLPRATESPMGLLQPATGLEGCSRPATSLPANSPRRRSLLGPICFFLLSDIFKGFNHDSSRLINDRYQQQLLHANRAGFFFFI